MQVVFYPVVFLALVIHCRGSGGGSEADGVCGTRDLVMMQVAYNGAAALKNWNWWC